MRLVRLAVCAGLVLLVGCPAPDRGTGPDSSRPAGINPGGCGKIDTTKVGRKIYAFLVASAELDKATIELEATVRGACRKMARELQVSEEGDTATLCKQVAKELENSLQVSVSQEQRLVTRTVPPVCTTEVEFAAEVVAECEASVSADVRVRCEGQCGGTCSGACDGRCAAKNADGSCAGQCEGTCRGSCSGGCQGSAQVDASAECKASAEVRAGLRTTCTEPKVEVVMENVTVVDASRLQRAVKAIELGMPTILQAGAKATIVAKAIVHWAKTAYDLAKAGKKVLAEIGDRGVCVGLQLAAALAASVNIQARIEVSVEVSASMSASAGAQ